MSAGWKEVAPGTVGVAKHRFVSNAPGTVLVNFGDEVEVTHESKGWYRCRSLANRQTGIVPANHILLFNHTTKPTEEYDDGTLEEVNKTLHNWGMVLRQFVRGQMLVEFDALKTKLSQLMEYRKALMTSEMPDDQKKDLRRSVIADINAVNAQFGLDFTVRLSSREVATVLNTGALSMHDLHVEQDPQAKADGISLLDDDDARDNEDNVQSPSGSLNTPKSRTLQHTQSKLSFVKEEKFATVSKTKTAKSTLNPGGSALSISLSGGYMQLWLQNWIVLVDSTTEFEVRVSLYNKLLSTHVSEEWITLYDADCKPLEKPRELGSSKALFKDVEASALSSGYIYAIFKIIRRGPFTAPDSRLKVRPENPMRRPFCFGVLQLKELQMSEAQVSLWQCPEPIFGVAPEILISSGGNPDPTTDIKPSLKAKGIIINTKSYSSGILELMESNPAIVREADPVDTLKIPEVVMPGTPRNDIYLGIDEAELSEKNVEVSCYLRRNGDPTATSFPFLSTGSGDKATEVMRGLILSTNAPHWRETLRLRFEDISRLSPLESHLFFELRHYSNSDAGNKSLPRPFGYAYLRLDENGTIIKDDRRKLTVYKYPSKVDGPFPYLEETEKKELGKSFISVSSRVASTQFSQNEHLNRLFDWKQNRTVLKDVLSKISFVANDEIVKHLELIFASLFGLLDDPAQDSKQLAYDALLYTIGKLTESKNSWNFRPVLNYYVLYWYKQQNLHESLLQCVSAALHQQILDNPSHAQSVLATMKVMDYIFTFIVQSKVNSDSAKALSSSADDPFKHSLLRFLDDINNLMTKRESRSLVGSQSFAFMHFPAILKGLSNFFTHQELCEATVKFLAISEPLTGLHNINMLKLRLYHSLATNEIFADKEQRTQLYPVIFEFMKRNFLRVVPELVAASKLGGEPDQSIDNKRREAIACIRTYGVLLDCLQLSCSLDEREKYIIQILPSVPQFVELFNYLNSPTSKSQISMLVLGTILSTLRLLTPEDTEILISHKTVFQTDAERMKFLGDLFELLAASILNTSYPQRWGSLVGLQYSSILKIATTLEGSPWFRAKLESFQNTTPDEFTVSFWLSFFRMCVVFCNSTVLDQCSLITLEHFGDMRVPMSAILRRTWQAVNHRHTLFPSLVPDFIALMNVSSKAVNQNAIDVYFAMFVSEFEKTGDISWTRKATVEAFDKNTFQESFGDFFATTISELFNQRGGAMKQKGFEFMEAVRSYIDLICRFAATPKSPANADEKICAANDLLVYLKQQKRLDVYVRYSMQMTKFHQAMGNWTEAGFVLSQLAGLYEWTEREESAVDFPNVCSFAKAASWERKQALTRKAIESFDKGKEVEPAISLLRDIKTFNERTLYNFKAVSTLLREQAAFSKRLLEERIPLSFYRVGFFGKGFPERVRNKDFIYKAKALEKLGDFQQRILDVYPKAELLKKTDTPGQDIRTSAGQFLLITPVAMSCEEDMQGKPGGKPQIFELNVFLYGKAFRKGPQDEDINEFQGLWLNQLYLKTSEKFPGILSRSEVIVQREMEFTPIQHAIKMMLDKNEEIRKLVERTEEKKDVSVQPLTMALQGVILAGVNGGIPKYREAFLSKKYIDENPAEHGEIARLSELIVQQIEILDHGMEVHNDRCQDMRSLHNILVEKLEEMHKWWETEAAKNPLPKGTVPTPILTPRIIR